MALFCTAYFPPIAMLAKMLQADNVQVEVKETFPKQTYRNRAVIMTAGGLRQLTVPVVRPNGNHSRTEEISISYTQRWNQVHLRTIEAAYSASPYYMYYKDDIETILSSHYRLLIDLNKEIFCWINDRLRLPLSPSLTTDFKPAGEDGDFRYVYTPKRPLSDVYFPPYYQTFSDRFAFESNLSILDLMMNLGPESRAYLAALEV